MLSLIQNPRFLLISLISYRQDPQVVQSRLDEAAALIATFGGHVVDNLTQNESHLSAGTYIGEGKAEEIATRITTEKIDVVVINDNLSSGQLNALRAIFTQNFVKVEVWDRTSLILHIFERHATTAEAKLQIKLAQTRHKGPAELTGLGKQLSQQGAGIGTRGRGETNTTVMKQHWQAEIHHLEKELDKIKANRAQQMENRKRLRLPTVSIVGYTNAGKSTLFNLLTKKQNLVEDAPFATLDSSVGKLYLQALQKEIFITDTIGFIQNLPHDLVDAFQSTLLETIHADILLHVIDAQDEFLPEKIETVESVLTDLGIADKKRFYVFNKIDDPRIADKESLMKKLTIRYNTHSPLFISAKTGEGLEYLIASIERELS